MVIAIDGPGGVGKSTVARRVAANLNIAYLDTGATYRAATVAVLRAGVDPDDPSGVLEAVTSVEISYCDGVIMLDGVPVQSEVRSPEVTAAVSAVSAIEAVREHIVGIQRKWVADHGGSAVAEGRDIGTVVFPDARVKIFLTARPGVRAERRSGDAEAGQRDVADIAADLHRRDHADSTRAVSPLRAAADAVTIDTSDMTIDEVVATVMDIVESRTG